jgi:hypothetical protein
MKHRSKGAASVELGQVLGGGAEVDAHAGGEARALEALLGDARVHRLALERVELAVGAEAAHQAYARVAAERPHLDGAARSRRAGQHLEVAAVERSDLDVG